MENALGTVLGLAREAICVENALCTVPWLAREAICVENTLCTVPGLAREAICVENTLCTVGEYKLCQTTINKESSESFSLLLLPVELHSNFSS